LGRYGWLNDELNGLQNGLQNNLQNNSPIKYFEKLSDNKLRKIEKQRK
jgi:hypothetical protein